MTMLLLLGCVSLAVAVASPTKPHVLYVLIDDWGWADAGWHRKAGELHGVSTPNLDDLVRDGVELTRHYVYKMCSPTRSAIQSGRNPIHASVVNTKETFHNPKDPVSGWSALPVNITGMGELMARSGYATHFYGKWDAGMATPLHTPLARGYQHSLFYFHHQNDYWTSVTDPKESDAGDTTCPGFPADRGPVDLWEDDHPASNVVNTGNCSQSQQHTCRYEDDIFSTRVHDAILSHDPSVPLFIFWAPHAVHDPLEVPKMWADRFAAQGPPSGRWERQYYLAILGWIDDSIGNVTRLLKSRGMWTDTLMIVHSDNGGPIYQNGNAGGNNWPLKGGKVSNWEGGIRVNAFVSGGFVPLQARGTKNDALIAGWDWYATLAAVAGTSPHDARAAAAGLPPVDSYDMWPMLAGTNTTPPREELPIGTDGGFIGIGQSMKTHVGGLLRGRYKILVQSVIPMAGWTGPVFPNLTKWDADYALEICAPIHEFGCLFDVIDDPSERHNLARHMPDVWHQMRTRMLEVEATVFSPDRGTQDPAACDAVANLYDGFWGPWALLEAWPEARAHAWQGGRGHAEILAQPQILL